jgi:outer membrane protein assembly factor BamD
MTRDFKALVAATIMLLLTGCPSWWQNETAEKSATPEQLFKEGDEYYQRKDYGRAVESYERLKSAFPDFKKIPEVYMKLGDAAYDGGDYEKAVSRYLQFIELYPSHAEASRAKYQIAMCYFNQIKKTDLDNSVVSRAAEAFKVVADDPKAGEWAKKAEEKQRECRRKLADKEYYKAQAYKNMGNNRAARMAAQRILDEYPKLGLDKEAEDMLKKLKDK